MRCCSWGRARISTRGWLRQRWCSPLRETSRFYGADNGDWAGRFGFSWDPFGKSKTVLRGGYGIFYDAPFDNLWQNVRNNNIVLPFYTVRGGQYELSGADSIGAAGLCRPIRNFGFSGLTLMDPKLRNGYAQDFFLGVQQSVGENLTIEVNGTGALGRRLITTDIVNRQFTTTSGDGRPNESLPDIAWRSAQGNSDYTALSAMVKYHWRTLMFQGAYTWSHAIDDQSDPLVGDFFDLDFTTDQQCQFALPFVDLRAAVQQQRRPGKFGFRPAAESVSARDLAVGSAALAGARLAGVVDGGVPQRVSLHDPDCHDASAHFRQAAD